jgi:hypothetical protein
MADADYFCFDEPDECLHTPGDEPAWNESIAFAAVEADGPSLFIRHGRRYNEGHIEISIAQLNPDGSLDVAFAKRPLSRADIGDGRGSVGGGLALRLVEPLRCWRAEYAGTLRRIAHHSAFAAYPGAALKAAPAVDCRFALEFRDKAPLFSHGPNGSMPGGERFLSGRHYESTLFCKGDITVDGTTRHIDTHGFRDHSWGVRDMTRMVYTRWFWVQVDARTSCVGWASRANDCNVGNGIILRDGKAEVAATARLSSIYDEKTQYARSARLELDSPNGNIAVDIDTGCVLPLRYERAGRVTRGLEFAARVKGTRWPAWVEYWDQMIDGIPAGNRSA